MPSPPLPLLVINLDRDAARWESARGQLAAVGLACERVPAVEGAKLPPEEIARLYSPARNARQFFRPLTSAEIGCYASHLQCARLIVERGLPAAVILEDDLVVRPDFPTLLDSLAGLARPYDLIKLYSNVARFTPLQSLAAGYRLCRFRRMPITTLAYALSRAGAAKFLQNALPMGRPVDVAFKHWWEWNLDILGVTPNAVTPAPVASSIGERTRLHRNLPTRLRRLRYKLAYAFLLWLHGPGPA
jgi:glycosyl transferase family 25